MMRKSMVRSDERLMGARGNRRQKSMK